jgi:hypothetical protein
MAARIVFTGGASIVSNTTDAAGLLHNLSRVTDGGQATEHGRPLPPGFVDVHTDDGVKYVHASQVAYVEDVTEEMPEVEQAERPSLHTLRGAPVRGRI